MSTISETPSPNNITLCPFCGVETPLVPGKRAGTRHCPRCWRTYPADHLDGIVVDDADERELDDEQPQLSFEPVVSADGSGQWLSPYSGVILTNQNVLDVERATRSWSLGFAEYRYYGGK